MSKEGHDCGKIPKSEFFDEDEYEVGYCGVDKEWYISYDLYTDCGTEGCYIPIEFCPFCGKELAKK